jgi:hypothetical protein
LVQKKKIRTLIKLAVLLYFSLLVIKYPLHALSKTWTTLTLFLPKRDREKNKSELGAGAHTYNPSYSEGRDQEDHGSRPAWADSS